MNAGQKEKLAELKTQLVEFRRQYVTFCTALSDALEDKIKPLLASDPNDDFSLGVVRKQLDTDVADFKSELQDDIFKYIMSDIQMILDK